MQSVLGQTYKNIEYILIDGGSTDGTVEVIQKHQHARLVWVSEPDKGIYDAMNKGIRLAKGEWINFMNAGDVFYNSDTISSLQSLFGTDTVLIYGDVRVRYANFERTQCAGLFSRLWKGMICCHQSVFIKRKILDGSMFNVKYNFASDYDLLCRIDRTGYNVTKTGQIISKVINNGQGDTKRLECLREFSEIAAEHFINRKPLVLIRYHFLILFQYLKCGIKCILPRKTVGFFTKYKYRTWERR